MESPSEEIVNAAKATVTVKDERGRQIEVRKPRILDRMRLFEMIGAENSSNQPYLGLAMLAYCVVSVEGEKIPKPHTKLALEGIVQRLDDDGFNAVAQAISDNFLLAAQSADEAKAAIKNE